MIDINYVQSQLDETKLDMLLPLRSWCRDLIIEVRKFEKEKVKYKLAIEAYKVSIEEVVQERDIVVEQFEALQKDNEDSA